MLLEKGVPLDISFILFLFSRPHLSSHLFIVQQVLQLQFKLGQKEPLSSNPYVLETLHTEDKAPFSYCSAFFYYLWASSVPGCISILPVPTLPAECFAPAFCF